MQNQAYVFAIFILNGLLIGILFDIFRILRQSFKTPDYVTYIEDILFWVISNSILLYSIFKFNNGELRIFIFIGVIIGILLYWLIFSKMFIEISVLIIKIIKKIFIILIITPLKVLYITIYNVIYKPSVKLNKIVKQSIDNIRLKTHIKNAKYKNKKDFE